MVPKNEVITELYNSLHVIWVAFFQQKEQFGFDCCLVVIFLLVLDQFDGDKLFVFVVQALDDLPEGSLANNFNQLESECDVVTFLDSVIAFFVIKSVVNESLHITCLNLEFILAQVIQLVILFNFCSLEVRQVLVGNIICFGLTWSDRELNLHIGRLVDCQLISFRCFGNDRVHHVYSSAIHRYIQLRA